MTYRSVSQEQLREVLGRALEGKLPAAAIARVVGRQVHLIYRRFGQGGKFYLRAQDRARVGSRTITHPGLLQILVEGAVGFLEEPQARALAAAQLREMIFAFGQSGHYYLARGNNGRQPMPEDRQRAIFRAWYLGGEDAQPEILNTYGIAFNCLSEVIARGQSEGWMRS